MHYVIGDVHNDAKRLHQMLDTIGFQRDGKEADHLYLLGDLFDRGGAAADPVEVYFTVLGLGASCTAVEGNHDRWLAAYIRSYYALPERKRKRQKPYHYESFELLRERLTDVDVQELAEWILLQMPLQAGLTLDGQRYLFAHAMTSPLQTEEDGYYLLGDLMTSEETYDDFLLKGTEGYISFCGHNPTDNLIYCPGEYCDADRPSIWHNAAGNVYMMDCGCGFADGRLACFCLETGERFYV